MTDDKAPDRTRIMPDTKEARFPKYRLVVIEGPDTGKHVEGGSEEVSVGTAEANDLVLGDPSVSRHHFVLAPSAKGLLARDLGSTNGTHLNGVLVERAYLAPGTVIAIGTTKLRFEPGGGEARAALSKESRWGRALGASEAMRKIFAVLPKLADSDATILLEGETGTGKGLLASAIHEASPRKSGPFIVIDCGSIPPNLIESELFGHEKGSFTGATVQRLGKFELCDGGTIFLDEIGDMALATQTKILRVLQQGEIQRVGGTETIRVDVRIIAATNKDLEEMVKAKAFREDLYYRLNVVRIRMPPLRERGDDVPQIVDFCLQNLVKQRKARVAKVSPEAMAVLTRHRWPGNVRELENVIYRSAVIAQGDAILVKDLPAEIRGAAGVEPTVAALGAGSNDTALDVTRTANAESVALATAKVVAESVATGEPALTLDRAFDFIFAQLSADGEAMLNRVDHEIARRAVDAAGGDAAAAAKTLGLTKVALQKRLKE